MSPLSSQDATYAAFVLALQQQRGIGPVTIHRLLASIPSPEALETFPREQLMHRLKGIPRVSQLIHFLYTPENLQEAMAKGHAALQTYAKRGIHLLTPQMHHYPRNFLRLPEATRPLILYAYGHLEVLQQPFIAFLGKSTLAPQPFEHAQQLMMHVLERGYHLAGGVRTGFDVVLHKLANGRPSLMVSDAGFARIPPPLRPYVVQNIRRGGLLLSTFPMEQEFYPHQIQDQIRVLGLLSQGLVWAYTPASTIERQAYDTCQQMQIPQILLPEHTSPTTALEALMHLPPPPA